ncbi:prim-pol domain containing protein [Amanita muscaria]
MEIDDVDSTSPEVMLTFYRRLYPFKSIFHWLNQDANPTRRFTHREFAFTLPGDIYLRYQSFNSAEDLKKQVCQLNPSRFEIGPVYSARPRDKKTLRPGVLTPVQRELVFDIDMTDYDPVRTCCSGAGICKRCWGFIAAAVHVLDGAIRDNFGYQNLLWVYSGRRGIHLWISDSEALSLTDDHRKALVEFVSMNLGGETGNKRLNIRSKNVPPSIRHAADMLNQKFPDLVLADQECFDGENGSETLLSMLPPDIVSSLRKDWTANPYKSSEDKWEDLKLKAKADKSSVLLRALQDIVLLYTYPRIDAEVSKHRNHLLKAPFCVHPKTGRVCVPVNPDQIEEFDPDTVPTVGQLLKELDAIPKDENSPYEHHADWEKTSLKTYVDLLNQHALRLMEQTKGAKREDDLSW